MPEPSEIEIITEATNAHGIFFKRAVRTELEKIPNLKVIAEEYPVAYLEGASLDLLVEHRTAARKYILPIECKRAYVQNKRWLFFEDPEHNSKLVYSFNQTSASVSGIKMIPRVALTVCVEGIEIDLSKSSRTPQSLYKVGNMDTIWKAGFQICKGGLGFLRQEYLTRQEYPDAKMEDFSSFLLVITSAPLSICHLSSQTVDPQSGRHVGPMQLANKKWLLFRYPFTPATQVGDHSFQVSSAGYVPPLTRGLRAKEGIIVLNIAHVVEFFEKYHDLFSED